MEKTKFRQYNLPDFLSQKIENILGLYNINLKDSRVLAQNVQQMSDYYLKNPEKQTPWSEKWCQIAQLVYFLPLNYLRARAVMEEAEAQSFFEDINSFYEVGSGLGALSLHLEEKIKNSQMQSGQYVEISKTSIDIHKKLSDVKATQWESKINYKCEKDSLLCFSYSLTEDIHFDQFQNYEGVLIIEPSLQKDGRNLMALRSRLISRGYSIWAPCIHQKDCPLLTHSQKDWCHDRIHLDMPEWFLNIEQHLPFKNKTITFSYLLARKKKPNRDSSQLARAVGDTLVEKGKSKVLICKGEEREFLSWLHRDRKDFEIHRGSLIELPENLEKKSNELRMK